MKRLLHRTAKLPFASSLLKIYMFCLKELFFYWKYKKKSHAKSCICMIIIDLICILVTSDKTQKSHKCEKLFHPEWLAQWWKNTKWKITARTVFIERINLEWSSNEINIYAKARCWELLNSVRIIDPCAF